MKRIGNLFEQICNLDNIKAAILSAAKHKTYRPHVKKVLENIEDYALDLQRKLLTNTLELSISPKRKIYDTTCNKTRTITIPRFYPDQVVHWLVITAIKPALTRGMYRYCCGSIPNRGGIDAMKYVNKAIKDEKSRYVIKLDISKFFDSCKPQILLQMLESKIKDNKIISLIAKILEAGGECLPIGYYTSQWFSNFYLQQLDHIIKEECHIKYYVRYVDDMVLIDSNKRKLRKALKRINEHLASIGLKLKDNWQLWHVNSRPIDFVGFRFYKNKTLLRKKIFNKLKRRTSKIERTKYCTASQARSMLSLLGWLEHIDGGYLYYKKYISDVISKRKLREIVSTYAKK